MDVHVVLIASGKQEPREWLGTGTLIAPGRILTARHVLGKDGKAWPNLCVRSSADETYHPGNVLWQGVGDVDVAVLEADFKARPVSHPLSILCARSIRASEVWEAKGYPKVRDKTPSTRVEKVTGTTCSSETHEALSLDATVSPAVWNGLSGAAIVVADRIVGVARAIPTGWAGKRLEGTPVGAFLEDKGFRGALGLGEHDDARIQRIVDAVAALLASYPKVAGALAKRLGTEAAPQALADHLVRVRKAMDVAKSLNHLDAALAKENGEFAERRAVRSLLWQILPFAVDWQELVQRERDRLAGALGAIELPYGSKTVAEIVIAGIDDRCCRFAPPRGAALPIGAALVSPPAISQAPIFDRDGTRFAQSVVRQIAAENDIGSSSSDYPKLREAVEGTLRYHALEAPEDELLPYYLLFTEADLKGANGEGDVWVLVRRALAAELPSLRLVRLTGASLIDETVLAKHIEALFRRMP